MSIPWGPALDAEVAYRHQQARNNFHGRSWRRKPATAHPAEVAAQPVRAQHVPLQRIPAQHGSVPLIPSPPRSIDQVTVPQQRPGQADAPADHEQRSAHAA